MRHKKLLVFVTVTCLFITLLLGCSQKPQTMEPPSVPVTPPTSVPDPAPTPVTVPTPTSEPEPLPLTPEQLTMLSISEGDVFIMKSGSSSWEEAVVETPLEPGDILKTNSYSNAVITFFEGSVIELQAGSIVEIVMLDIAEGTGSTTIKLNQEIGKTISRVVKLTDSASRYDIETPAGIAVVRGSTMLLQVSRSGRTTITNQGGNIWAFAQGVEVKVPEGKQFGITPGGLPTLVRPPNDDGGEYVPEPVAKIAINKTASPEIIYPGDLVTYNYTLTNPGDDPLSNIVVTDDKGLAVVFISGDTDGDSKLDPGETWIYTATANNLTEDVINIGTATGTDSKGGTVSDNDTAEVNVINPAIAINKTASSEFIYTGNDVTYNYTLTNPGDDPLSDIVVIDDQGLTVVFITGDTNTNSKLDPGETWIYTATANNLTEDVINIGTATGTDSKGGTVSDNGTAEVVIVPPVQMTVISDTSTVVTNSSSGYAEPDDLAELAGVGTDWWVLDYNFTPSGAQLIWESNTPQNPVSGDVVDFEKTFTIPGTPVSGTLYITCDNGYEAYVNGNGYPAGHPIAMSAQLGSGWRWSDLTEGFVNHSGWESVESWDITAYLLAGENILRIGTANEQNPITPNPAGLIFEIIISYEAELAG